MSDALADLEIVAGHVWNAVGGPPGAEHGEVEVMQVDPKRFGIEIAAGTTVQWVKGEEGNAKQIVLATLRPFKPMDLIIVEKTDEDGELNVTTGLTRIRLIEVNGVNQFTAKNPVESAVFGSLLSAPRPRIRFDTVQTAPNLTMDMECDSRLVIGDSVTLTASAIFSGVAIKR